MKKVSLDHGERLRAVVGQVEPTVRPLCLPLGMEAVNFIASDGCYNAAGGIYATRVQEFAREVQRAFAGNGGTMTTEATPGALGSNDQLGRCRRSENSCAHPLRYRKRRDTLRALKQAPGETKCKPPTL